MTGVRLEDLPPKLRAQVEQKLGEQPKAKKGRRGASRVATDGVCWACGVRFMSSAKWERHSDETGHRRFELVQTRGEPT